MQNSSILQSCTENSEEYSKTSTRSENMENIDVENAVADTLKQIGIPKDTHGYAYLKTAILLSLEEEAEVSP
jgi:hypothetical protein